MEKWFQKRDEQRRQRKEARRKAKKVERGKLSNPKKDSGSSPRKRRKRPKATDEEENEEDGSSVKKAARRKKRREDENIFRVPSRKRTARRRKPQSPERHITPRSPLALQNRFAALGTPSAEQVDTPREWSKRKKHVDPPKKPVPKDDSSSDNDSDGDSDSDGSSYSFSHFEKAAARDSTDTTKNLEEAPTQTPEEVQTMIERSKSDSRGYMDSEYFEKYYKDGPPQYNDGQSTSSEEVQPIYERGGNEAGKKKTKSKNPEAATHSADSGDLLELPDVPTYPLPPNLRSEGSEEASDTLPVAKRKRNLAHSLSQSRSIASSDAEPLIDISQVETYPNRSRTQDRQHRRDTHRAVAAPDVPSAFTRMPPPFPGNPPPFTDNIDTKGPPPLMAPPVPYPVAFPELNEALTATKQADFTPSRVKKKTSSSKMKHRLGPRADSAPERRSREKRKKKRGDHQHHTGSFGQPREPPTSPPDKILENRRRRRLLENTTRSHSTSPPPKPPYCHDSDVTNSDESPRPVRRRHRSSSPRPASALATRKQTPHPTEKRRASTHTDFTSHDRSEHEEPHGDESDHEQMLKLKRGSKADSRWRRVTDGFSKVGSRVFKAMKKPFKKKKKYAHGPTFDHPTGSEEECPLDEGFRPRQRPQTIYPAPPLPGEAPATFEETTVPQDGDELLLEEAGAHLSDTEQNIPRTTERDGRSFFQLEEDYVHEEEAGAPPKKPGTRDSDEAARKISKRKKSVHFDDSANKTINKADADEDDGSEDDESERDPAHRHKRRSHRKSPDARDHVERRHTE